MQTNTYKPRKGDVIAVARTHSSTGIIGSGRGTTSYTTFTLAYAESVKKDGTISKLRFAGGSPCLARGLYDCREHALPIQQVKNLFRSNVKLIGGENQRRARKLADSIEGIGRDWDSPEALKADILAQL